MEADAPAEARLGNLEGVHRERAPNGREDAGVPAPRQLELHRRVSLVVRACSPSPSRIATTATHEHGVTLEPLPPHWMPQFRPAAPKLPKSHVRVPYREREQLKPVEVDKAPKQEPLLWARRLPYKLVQGSHIGHGIRMEPSRKVRVRACVCASVLFPLWVSLCVHPSPSSLANVLCACALLSRRSHPIGRSRRGGSSLRPLAA